MGSAGKNPNTFVADCRYFYALKILIFFLKNRSINQSIFYFTPQAAVYPPQAPGNLMQLNNMVPEEHNDNIVLTEELMIPAHQEYQTGKVVLSI